MIEKQRIIREGITLFEGKLPRNLLFESVVSNAYFLEDGSEVILFDPSCGKKIGRRIENYIQNRKKDVEKWKKAIVIAGHSHFDHANNFYLSDVMDAKETRVYVHEKGFKDGKVKNDPYKFVIKLMHDLREFYNPYLSLFFPYNILIFPFFVLDKLSSTLADKLFSAIGSLPFPRPNDGAVRPEALKEKAMEQIDINGVIIDGWRAGKKIIFPTPGHSPCSVSLFWPKKNAIFVSDAVWFGNPLFLSSSLIDSISSLETIKKVVKAGDVDLLLPAHGEVRSGMDNVLNYLDFNIQRLQILENEIISFYHASGAEKDILELTKLLVEKSPLFKFLKHNNYPRNVVFVHSLVVVCLKDEGLMYW